MTGRPSRSRDRMVRSVADEGAYAERFPAPHCEAQAQAREKTVRVIRRRGRSYFETMVRCHLGRVGPLGNHLL